MEYVLTNKAVGSIDFVCLSRRLSLYSGLVTSRGRNPAPFDIEMVLFGKTTGRGPDTPVSLPKRASFTSNIVVVRLNNGGVGSLANRAMSVVLKAGRRRGKLAASHKK